MRTLDPAPSSRLEFCSSVDTVVTFLLLRATDAQVEEL
jgi:hypothetical protein